jgi:hypothetical protein
VVMRNNCEVKNSQYDEVGEESVIKDESSRRAGSVLLIIVRLTTRCFLSSQLPVIIGLLLVELAANRLTHVSR